MTSAELLQLKTFYSVQTDRELIEVMASHIESLQNKLATLQPPIPIRMIIQEG